MDEDTGKVDDGPVESKYVVFHRQELRNALSAIAELLLDMYLEKEHLGSHPDTNSNPLTGWAQERNICGASFGKSAKPGKSPTKDTP